jgi:hypothetical protein
MRNTQRIEGTLVRKVLNELLCQALYRGHYFFFGMRPSAQPRMTDPNKPTADHPIIQVIAGETPADNKPMPTTKPKVPATSHAAILAGTHK